MKRLVRIALGALATCAAIVLLGAVLVYLLAERVLNRTFAVTANPVAFLDDAAAIAQGERLARICGCHGCHGKQLEGTIFVEDPLLGRLIAPNLTRIVREYSPVDLVRSIRQGVKPDGRSVLAMPSSMFSFLSDQDLGAIIGYVRSLPAIENSFPGNWIGLPARWEIARGAWPLEATLIDQTAPRVASADLLGARERGRYLAAIACTECHGLDREGFPGDTPPLSIVAGYSEEDFRRLMSTGIALGSRRLRMMSDVAVDRFARFTDAEVGALYDYLRSSTQT